MSKDGEISYSPPWKNAAQELFSGKFGFGDMVTHEELNAALSMPEPTGTAEEYKNWSLARMPQLDALSQWLAAQPVPPGAKPLHEWPAARKMPVACGGVSVEAAPTGVPR